MSSSRTGTSKVVEVDGISKTRLEWCEHLGISSSLISMRMRRESLSLEGAIRMGGRKVSHKVSLSRYRRAVHAAIPLPTEPLRQCASDPDSFVTEDGRVWNNIRKRWMAISSHAPNKNRPEERFARVRVGRALRYVHTVVAQAWLENAENHPWVFHKDNNKLNNHKDNLQWASISEMRKLRKPRRTKRQGAPL